MIYNTGIFRSKACTTQRESTKNDEEIQNLIAQIIDGWPSEKQQLAGDMKPYWDFRDELAVYDGIVFKGERIVIPKSLQKKSFLIFYIIAIKELLSPMN